MRLNSVQETGCDTLKIIIQIALFALFVIFYYGKSYIILSASLLVAMAVINLYFAITIFRADKTRRSFRYLQIFYIMIGVVVPVLGAADLKWRQDYILYSILGTIGIAIVVVNIFLVAYAKEKKERHEIQCSCKKRGPV